jgi:hypothetical protein
LFASWYVRIAAIVVVLAVPVAFFVLHKTPVDAMPCPCNVFTTPTGHSDFNDGSDLELGFKFRADVNGYITGVRFYKQGAMSGTHVGNLWTEGGSNLSSATFTETASGWQEVSFGSPVAVTAGTMYVASVSMLDGRYIATTNYFSSEIVNFPLRAPASVGSGGNGVFVGNAGDFPTNSSNAANYWIDVAYRANLGTTPPVVDSTVPTNSSTDVNPGKMISATFDDKMDPSTLTTSTFGVRDSEGNLVAGSVAYSITTSVATFAANEGFELGETYTATLEGGTGTVATNSEGIALAADHTWSFTVSSTNACPCSLQERTNPAGASSFDETSGVELGVKITPLANGYLSKVRFYKPIISPDTTHTVHVWSSTGSSLATATTSGESDYGWQEVTLPTPLRVNEGTTYVLSYTTPSGAYMASPNYFSADKTNDYLRSYATGSAQNAATGSGNSNGVFNTTQGAYPGTGSPNGSYYWIDALFSVSSDPADPLEVDVVQPSADQYGVDRTKPVRATFNRALTGGTVTNSTFRLFDSSNVQVSGNASYEGTSHSAVFTPSSPLTYGQRYTARISAGVEDLDGTALGAEYAWSFTVGKELASDINQGPGGPVLVITSTTNKYSPYYVEILRTEGLNYFDAKDISTVSAATLDGYDAVVLAEMSLSQAEADMFSDWVTADGGNLIAMRPDKKLASLLGLTDAASTRTNQYMLVNTAAAPGTGIVSETIQFKGTADNYTLNGATSVATFYSDATTSTSNPATTVRSVGSNGGTAAAFTYDLAKSVIALHQGNQAWAGDERDGEGPRRSNDLFFGAKSGDVQPDWVNLDKSHIPQADEQQRLLANMLIEAAKDRRPFPRFWYLPGEHKAAMVMAGDDHGLNDDTGTQRTFSNFLNESPTQCELDKWECVRGGNYVYEGASLTNARALQFHNLGFEVADHPTSGCGNVASYAALGAIFTADLATWRAKYTSIPNQRTNRIHCYAWPDWDSMARVEHDNGMRYDLNYTTYPASWIGTRPAIINGTGMNMRFTDADGDMLDVYQGVTNFENTVTGAAAINAVFDNASGSTGYYGIFGTHFDMSDPYHFTLFDQAKANNVSIISSDQALTWLDGRNSSKFSAFGGGDGQFTFTIDVATGAQNLRAMMPTADDGGTLTGITRAGGAVSYQTQTVKGVQYAIFDGQPGDYTVTYSDYNPNSGGSSGGSSGGGGSSSGGSSSPSKSSSKKKIATQTPTEDATDQPETVFPPAETPDAEEPEQQEESPRDVEKDPAEGVPILVWLGAISLVAAIIGGILWLLAKRRHRNINW